jgi:hypothetical protein
MSKTMKPSCVSCGDTFSRARKNLGYKWCMPCGEGKAQNVRHTIVPSHKSNYIVVTDMNDLKDLNPKYIRSAR